MASPSTSACTTVVHDSKTELLTYIVLYMRLPRLCVITKERMIQNKVHETCAHIFLTTEDPQFKMCWCIFPACLCLHLYDQIFMITYAFHRCNSKDFLSRDHICHAKIDHQSIKSQWDDTRSMWKFIWLCARSSYIFVGKEKSMTFPKYVMWHSISLHLINKQAGSHIFCHGRQA